MAGVRRGLQNRCWFVSQAKVGSIPTLSATARSGSLTWLAAGTLLTESVSGETAYLLGLVVLSICFPSIPNFHYSHYEHLVLDLV